MWKDTGFFTACGIFFSVFPLPEPCVGTKPCFSGTQPCFSGCKGFPSGHGPVQRSASFLLLRSVMAFRAAPAPHSVQQASCCFGVRTPPERSRPRTASSKLPATSGCVPLPGGPDPAQRPASFLLLRGAYPFQAVPAPNSDQQASLVSSWSLFEGQTLSLRCFPGCSVYGILFS